MLGQRRHLIIGLLLIAVGAVSLLGNLHFLDGISDYLFALMFAAVGLVFSDMYRDGRQMRHLVGSASFMLVAFIIVLDALPGVDEDMTAVVLFWGFAAVGVYAFSQNRTKWGLALGSGIAFSIGTVVLADMLWPYSDDMQGAAFMLGLSLTFWYLYTLRNEQNRLAWARIPAFINAVLFLTILTASSDLPELALPLVLIATGIGMLIRSNRRNLPESHSPEAGA